MKPPYVIFGLPRSRTAWLSAFLTYGQWQCGHDQIIYCRSLEDITSWLDQPCTGTVETGASPYWRLLRQLRPDVRIVVVRRPVDEVVDSLMRLGLGFDEAQLRAGMRRLDCKLDQIQARLPVYAVAHADLAEEATCAKLFEHCLPYPHDHDWWAALAARNIQASVALVGRYMHAYRAQLAKLSSVARHRMLAGLARQAVELDGVTFQTEPFDQFYRDARPLFREHLVQTDQAPEDHARKNLALMRRLDRIGGLQVMTARSNGRMFGYLMSVVAPSLDVVGQLYAEHTLFFASPDVRGLGMKLQRAALAALRERGVKEVQMRAGIRGAGPRLGTIYRRLGAEEFGELYRLRLED